MERRTSLFFYGTYDFTKATVLGNIPATPSETVNVSFQADALNPTHISANVALALTTAPGLVRLAGDLGGTSSSPTVLSVANITSPVAVSKGGTGELLSR